MYIGIISAIIGSILLTTGLAFGKEYADKSWGGEFDWLDISATLIGGTIGQIIHTFIIYLLTNKFVLLI